MAILVEVCVDSVESALEAVRGGAERIELCCSLGLGGGTTPTLGLLKSVQKSAPNIPIMAMVRPRLGDFLYSDLEFDVMLAEVQAFKQYGVHGVVFGILTADGQVDTRRSKLLADQAAPLEVCFHRAFDMTRDPIEALVAVHSIGIGRILTSGHGKSAPSSLAVLERLFRSAKQLSSESGRNLTILPGSGINAGTVGPLISSLLPFGLSEIHMSGGHWAPGGMAYRPDGMGMGVGGEGEWGIWRTERTSIAKVIDELMK